jgi:hypothetical protein
MADTIADTWHMFQIRRTLLTAPHLGFDIAQDTIRVPQVQQATASLLYIILLGILDDATATQMSADDFIRCGKLANRLGFLAARGKLLDAAGLSALRGRRNELGHEPDRDASVEELEAAVQQVQEQLLAWRLVEGRPAYHLQLERSGIRESGDPGYLWERDFFIRVIRGDRCYMEIKQIQRIGRD